MQTVITGATGFVGQNLVPYLKQAGHDITPLSVRGNWQQQLPAHYDAIIHLAGKAHDVKNTSEASEYFKINTELTQQLFDRFLQSDARDFIYFSSVKAAADSVPDVLTEEVVPAPATPYGQSKQQAEAYLLARPLPAGKRLFIIRPCMIHGPGNKGNLNLLYKFVTKGIPYPLAAFKNKRSYLSVDNLSFVVKELLARPSVPSGIYNLADDAVLSTNELVTIIGNVLGRKQRLMAIPQGLLKAMARVGDVLHLPLSTEKLKKLTENYVVSNRKIKKALNLEQLPVSAAEGLKKTIESFRAA
ncbi:NAD-dependent epimerase/dehydratase family protein [Taibaiella chishuiensis]|uniref:Nucleoside-diphosphate-sugar epimerase n=1 Tax=Taibaiella chishuiensis TaxID=1434707 RepID=A0A2P8DB84_9BACT|nr:NAD-dependent epimerase/dehydratase family protein [Taibaiella chishuiensis]PSK94470.1 nucleoside-diphosphate-sugar epimerase [Taibaiella chishuiensis]